MNQENVLKLINKQLLQETAPATENFPILIELIFKPFTTQPTLPLTHGKQRTRQNTNKSQQEG